MQFNVYTLYRVVQRKFLERYWQNFCHLTKNGDETDIKEKWVVIDEFPEYAVSDCGRVINTSSDILKTPTSNQQGIASINFSRDRIQCRRSLTLLVAQTFLPDPERESFDTPINLDGDRFNNNVNNLMWRPRWFAVKYHAQLKKPTPFGFTGGIDLVETEEHFNNVRECAVKYGLLEKEIILAAHNRKPVFPIWCNFSIS